MAVGAGGAPPAGRFVAAMAGLALACGGASALNHLIDRDLDRAMSRTDRRPVAAGRVAPSRALEFGLALSAGSFVLLSAAVNPLTAVLALAGNLFYVVVYTRVLKRSTPQNIVIGGAAGAVPPLVGWAAATGNLTVPALALFAIVFVWTPPHFWALAILIKDDYKAAGVPMLPVVRGDADDGAPDPRLHPRARAGHALTGRGGHPRPGIRRCPRSSSAGASQRSPGSSARDDSTAGRGAVPFLARLPGAPLCAMAADVLL